MTFIGTLDGSSKRGQNSLRFRFRWCPREPLTKTLHNIELFDERKFSFSSRARILAFVTARGCPTTRWTVLKTRSIGSISDSIRLDGFGAKACGPEVECIGEGKA